MTRKIQKKVGGACVLNALNKLMVGTCGKANCNGFIVCCRGNHEIMSNKHMKKYIALLQQMAFEHLQATLTSFMLRLWHVQLMCFGLE